MTLDEYQTYFLTLLYRDCLYHNRQVRTNLIMKVYLFVSYFCVNLGDFF